MLALVVPDAAQVERWLRQAGIHHYICDQCHGLHLSELQSREGVLDSRLFVEEDGLLLSTEVEIRPASMLMLLAEIPRLNMTWPSLKIFIDVNDDALPRVVACDLLLGRAGVAFEQFIHFVQANVDATSQLLDECQQLGCLFGPEDDIPANHDALH
ncbi:MAG: YbjN domain-containing protein [Alcanivoracaceae bacterium]